MSEHTFNLVILLLIYTAWLPAEPGKRRPVANLPISILHTLNQKADLQARRRITLPRNRDLSRDPGKSQETRRTSSFDNKYSSPPGSDSDAPVPDNEWPPSPARDQLPPDSSAENIGVRTAHIRRSSNASSLSGLTQSKRPTPLVTSSSTNSAVPSPLVMSPSIVPNPARPRSQQQSRSITPKSSASRPSAPVSVGATSAVSHSMEQRTFAGHHEFLGGDESVGEVRAALEDTMSAIMPQCSPGVSEILSELKPRHGNDLGRSPEVKMKMPLVHSDPFEDGILSPHRASTPVEPLPLQSSRAPSATENLNGSRRHNRSSGLYSIPPSPESDLEVAAPFSLNDKAKHPSKLTHKPFPSTASQPTEPFTQVKQTPYVKGQIENHSPPRLERQLSFPRSNACDSLANGNPSEDVDHVTQSTPSILEVSSSEAFIDSTKQNVGMKIVDKISATMKAIDGMQSHSVQPSGNSERRAPEILSGGHDYRNESDAIEKPSAAASSEEGGRFEVHTQGNRDIHLAHSDSEMKRKASDLGFLSTHVAKRRKKFKIPRAFPVTENIENLPDPLDAARHYRQNFISSRKCSEAGQPQKARLTPSAVSKTESLDLIDLRMNPEDQVAPEVIPEINGQTLVDEKAQASGFQDDETMKINFLTKRSAEDESDRMDRLAPGNAQPMAPSMSKSSIQGIKVGETETQSKSLPLNGLNELTPDPKVKVAHLAKDNGSQWKKNMHNLRELVSNPDDEDGLKDTVSGAPPYSIPDHDFDDDDAQNTTPIDQSLYAAAKIAGPDSQHNHSMGSEVDDAIPGAQAVDVTDLEAKLARTDESADQATDFGVDDARPSVQSDQVMVSDATQRPEIDESMHLDSGSTRSYPTNDQFKEVEAQNLLPGAQHGEAMDNQPDDFIDDIGRLDTVKLTKDEPGPHVNGESLHISGNRSGSDDPKDQSSLELQESLLPDNSKSISESPNSSESLVPEADCMASQPNHHIVSPVQVAPVPLRNNVQDSQRHEALAIAMSVEPANPSLREPPNSPAVIPAPVSNLGAGFQFPESPPEQSALAQILQPDANVKTAAVVIGSTAEHKGPEMPVAPQNIFSRFRAAYPAYSGDLKHFGAVCRKIKTLVGLDRMLHQFLWDDFIIRHKIEYAQHLRQCAEDADDAVPYEDFYTTEIKKPLYCYGLVTPQNLDEVLSLLDTNSSVPSKRKINDIATATKATRNARIVDQEPSLAPERSSTRMQKRSKRRETIDLTLDDPEDHSIKSEDTSGVSPMSGARKVRRSLPWKETNTQTEKPSPQRREPRPLPWKETNTPAEKPSPQRREPVDVGARLRASKEPSDTPTKLDRQASKNPDATTDGRSIRETWGIGAHDVLESRYYDKISARHLQLMKNIANVVDLEEARRLIYYTIHARAGLRQGVSKAVTVADLEAVLQGLLTKNVKKGGSRVKENVIKMVADPPSTHQTRASHEKRKGEGPGEWWKDENTPFKSFAKAYKSIKPGNGNSFAKEVPARTEAGASRAVKRDRKTAKKQIDPLSWEL